MPPKPALPLTAALTALSYTLSESEFSADGDEFDPLPESPKAPPAPTPTPLVQAVSIFTPHKPTSNHLKIRSDITANSHVTACSSKPCFPGVQCEPAVGGGFRCGTCPAGYIGDGHACRGKAKPKRANVVVCDQVWEWAPKKSLLPINIATFLLFVLRWFYTWTQSISTVLPL